MPISGYPYTNNHQNSGHSRAGRRRIRRKPLLRAYAHVRRRPLAQSVGTGKGSDVGRASRPLGYANRYKGTTRNAKSGKLPPINLTGPSPIIGYPLLWGGQVYRLADWYLGPQASYQFAVEPPFLQLRTTSFDLGSSTKDNRVFSGRWRHETAVSRVLGIQIDNGDGNGPTLYLITGVYPQLGSNSP